MANVYDFAYEELFAGDGAAIKAYLELVYALRMCKIVNDVTIQKSYDLGVSTGAAMALHIWNVSSPLSAMSANSNREKSPEQLAEYSANVFWDDFPKMEHVPFEEQPVKLAFIEGWFDGNNGKHAPESITPHLKRIKEQAQGRAKKREFQSRKKMHALIDRLSDDQIQRILEMDW